MSHPKKSLSPRHAGHRLVVVDRAVDTLTLDPKNLRAHSPRQIRQIARSIKAFGFNTPILIDSQLKVIAGEGRLLACRQLGWTDVPTICLEHLNEAQKQAFMIADNRLTETSVWDDQLLAGLLKELFLKELDFSLEATGFELEEIDLQIGSLERAPAPQVERAPAPQGDPADAIPEHRPEAPVSRTGDLWLLGRHRVYCASALDPTAYTALMAGEQAAMVFTDPPHNVPSEGHASGLERNHHDDFVTPYGEMDERQFAEFLTGSFTLLARHSIDGAIHFICADWRQTDAVLAAGRTIYAELKDICVWTKDNAGMGSLYRSEHEFVFVFKHGRSPHRNNIQPGRRGRRRSNV